MNSSVSETSELRLTVLVVDKDVIFRERLVSAFRGRGYAALSAGSIEEALRQATLTQPDYVVFGCCWSNFASVSLIEALQEFAIRIVVLAGPGGFVTLPDAVRSGMVGYLRKPVDADQITAAFEGQTAERKVRSAGRAAHR